MKLHFHDYSKWSEPIKTYDLSMEQYCYCKLCNKVKYRSFHTSKIIDYLPNVLKTLKEIDNENRD